MKRRASLAAIRRDPMDADVAPLRRRRLAAGKEIGEIGDAAVGQNRSGHRRTAVGG